jgi:two-component system NtrC family sensor kinase
MKYLIVFFSISFVQILAAQNKPIDSLKNELAIAKQDTIRVQILRNLSFAFDATNQDSSKYYAQKCLDLAQKINYSKGEASALERFGQVYWISGDYPKALSETFKGLKIAQDNHHLYEIVRCLNAIGNVYKELKDYQKALSYYQRALKTNKDVKNVGIETALLLNIATVYRNTNQLDSALIYSNKAEKKEKFLKNNFISHVLFFVIGRIQFDIGNHRKAFEYVHKAILINKEENDHRTLASSYLEIAHFFKKINRLDSSIYYAKNALTEAQFVGAKKSILEAGNLLAELYDSRSVKEALYYNKIVKALNEELYGATKVLDLQKIMADEQTRQQEIEVRRIASENQLKLIALLSGLTVMFLVAFVLYRNNLQKQKANIILEKTLSELKSTQSQLIQKEKLASLGELTAGIAHEIQNPLNFVNNFSELSIDLSQELKEEIEKVAIPQKDKEYIEEILGDLTQNQEKINYHGKRASSIVKGMLEHSRTGTGERQLTDINQLADEYLRLSYHGLRAKNNDFNSDYELITDEHLPKIEVVPQEIGRVLLNLINNAFYAVNERAKRGETGYQPKVTVSTRTADNQVQIRVSDNGLGIPDTIKAKIFQPFFTTKPTGEGTGLGLSLAYDIVTKGHGGTLEVESVEGVGTTFTIKLPIKTI